MNAILENIRRGITTREVFAVIVVTSLIWLYAEAESVATTSVETFVRVLSPEGSDRVVDPADPSWSGAISVRLQGARGSIDAARSSLTRGIDLTLGSGGVPVRPGQHSINLQTAIQNAALQDHTGVVVAAVEPASLTIDVESIVRIDDVPIRFVAPDGLLVSGDPVIDPVTASITAPQSVVDMALSNGSPLSAILRLSESDLDSLTAGVSRTMTGALDLPDGLLAMSNVSISPQSAAVTLRIQSQLSEVVLPSVPIWELIPPIEADNWLVTIEPPFITDLTVSGPTDLVRRVESGEIRVLASVELSSETLEAGSAEVGIQFPGLPAGLQVNADALRVTITSARREAVGQPQQP